MSERQKIAETVTSMFRQEERNINAGGIQANKIFKTVHDLCRYCTYHDAI